MIAYRGLTLDARDFFGQIGIDLFLVPFSKVIHFALPFPPALKNNSEIH